MELLLFLLAILFSIFSALMERRRRRREQVEEAQRQHAEIDQQHAEVNPAAPVVAEEQKEKEEEPTFGWPFDGDPFEEPVLAEVDPAEAEREALEAERLALEAERRAVAAEQQAMERLTETKPEESGEGAAASAHPEPLVPHPSDGARRDRLYGNPRQAEERTRGVVNAVAGVAELVDALDSKSCIRKGVWVRVPPPAPFF